MVQNSNANQWPDLNDIECYKQGLFCFIVIQLIKSFNTVIPLADPFPIWDDLM